MNKIRIRFCVSVIFICPFRPLDFEVDKLLYLRNTCIVDIIVSAFFLMSIEKGKMRQKGETVSPMEWQWGFPLKRS